MFFSDVLKYVEIFSPFLELFLDWSNYLFYLFDLFDDMTEAIFFSAFGEFVVDVRLGGEGGDASVLEFFG